MLASAATASSSEASLSASAPRAPAPSSSAPSLSAPSSSDPLSSAPLSSAPSSSAPSLSAPPALALSSYDPSSSAPSSSSLTSQSTSSRSASSRSTPPQSASSRRSRLYAPNYSIFIKKPESKSKKNHEKLPSSIRDRIKERTAEKRLRRNDRGLQTNQRRSVRPPSIQSSHPRRAYHLFRTKRTSASFVQYLIRSWNNLSRTRTPIRSVQPIRTSISSIKKRKVRTCGVLSDLPPPTTTEAVLFLQKMDPPW